MVLVPQESLQVTQNILPSIQTPGDPVTRLDAEMNNVLMSNGKDDREKWNRFQQLFSRFLQTMPSKPSEKLEEQHHQVEDPVEDTQSEPKETLSEKNLYRS